MSFTRKTVLLAAGVLLAASVGTPKGIAQGPASEQPDKYTWLEDIHGDKSMDWVKAENARTAAVMEKQKPFAGLEEDALKVLDSPDKLAFPQFRAGMVYNTWRDKDHVRGIVRRTTLESYLSDAPNWETVIDYDALGKQDKQSWVGHGLECLQPEEKLCLVSLSSGGEDAATLREFDLPEGKFVENGFVSPRGKQRIAWLDKDNLLIAREWGEGTMSVAGYPIEVKRWKRGTPLESAVEVFRGDAKDEGSGVDPVVLTDGLGHSVAVIENSKTFFETEYYLVLASGPKKLGLPMKANVRGLQDNQVVISLEEQWTPEGQTKTYPQGAVVSLDLEAVKADPVHLKPTVLFAPTAQEFSQQVATTKNHVLVTTLEHVQGRAYVYTHGKDGKWTRSKLAVPDNESIGISTTSLLDDRFFLSETGFLTPSSVLLGDAAVGSLKPGKTQKALFDASRDVVEQLEATSKDGTKVPYFAVHRKDMPMDGSTPTLLTAYGGFQVSNLPAYNPVFGKLWLERGGTFVLANIRGGGEFGPAWHDAGLKTHRQRIYDDFYAVAEDLVTRKFTSKERLGIEGGSNGGLLMGVEFNQHPEMWKAVVIQVPLLDMLGYEHMSAGASWVGEYGSVKVPAERAFLASISPYNQLKPDVHYPEPLIFTTTADDRVGPVHARKFAAKMEEFHEPFYYDEITEGGHGAGADNRQAARTWAEEFTYLAMKLMD
ncbi:MAG TPA: prolyl oligopeptidase family serine peptidase [Terracidiphilus sp.]|nr:prolyl oligopeptidase family serine peptidase [Terracidiphilus sp.]